MTALTQKIEQSDIVGNPLVSILIPTYNSASYINATLESALGQSWRNIEVIVVDDGSTDDSVDHIRRFEQRGVRLIQQRNSGAAAARNRAFSASSGEFVQFLDADDLLSPQKIEQQLERLSAQPSCVASCAWGRFTRDGSDYNPNPEPVWRDLPALDWLALSRADGLGMMFPAIWLIPRDLIIAAGPWNEDLSLNDDTEYFTRLLTRVERVLFTPNATAFYRSGVPGSLSGRKADEHWRSAFKVHELCEAHLIRRENTERMRRAASLSWQQFAFSCYPYQAKLAEEALRRAEKLSAAKIRMPDAGVFGIVAALVGWKWARRLQGWRQS